jgi:hypothetical protein
MKKLMFILVAMAFIAFGYTAGAYAAGMDKSTGEDTGDVSAWIGKDVKNPEGEDLGKIDEFVRDEGGEVSLAIISHGGFLGMGDKKVAVPYNALSFNEGEDHAILDVTEEQLANAPAIGENEDPADREFAEEVHRYFGERPRWSYEESETRGYFGTDRLDTDLETIETMPW